MFVYIEVSIWVAFLISTALIIFFQNPDPHSSSVGRYAPPILNTPEGDDLNGVFARGPSETVASAKRRLLSYDEKNFTLDGKPIRIVSGSVHYFRMVPSSWLPVLLHAKAMGLNAISTYVPWNLHEQSPGFFRFSGILDLRAFLETCHEVGLMVILRPGPYICSEWENGGLPPFLLANKKMDLRSSFEPYLNAVGHYLDLVAHQIEPYLGRPVMAIQLENEYGIFGSDKKYLDFLLETWFEEGVDRKKVMFFTSENGGKETVLNGSQFDSDIVLKTANLKTGAGERIKMLREIQPKAPAMISEFWTGWFDHWGKPHHTRNGSEIVEEVLDILKNFHASVNMYMLIGGTNFGFMNGANIDRSGKYWSVVTSYDYDGMLNEFGAVRKKKYAPMQSALREFWNSIGDSSMVEFTYTELPKPPSISSYAEVIYLDESIGLFDVLEVVTDKKTHSMSPLTMEEAGGDYGMILYRHNLTESDVKRPLYISGVKDHGFIIIDGRIIGRVDRNDEHGGNLPKKFDVPPKAKRLDVLVENRGRVTVGPFIHDRKGITGKVSLSNKVVEGFECSVMSFAEDHLLLRDSFGRKTITSVRNMMSGKDRHGGIGDVSRTPVFFRGELFIGSRYARYKQELAGTHCKINGQGVLWVNGFNVGRFNTEADGPQGTLYVPGELLHEGVNEFMVLHMRLDLMDSARIQLVASTDIGEA